MFFKFFVLYFLDRDLIWLIRYCRKLEMFMGLKKLENFYIIFFELRVWIIGLKII